MLLLRYQRQRQAEAEEYGGRGGSSDHEKMLRRTKINDRDLKGESRRAATRGTLICIFVCGTLLLGVGISILCVGLLVLRHTDPTPWLVIGPTCIVLGVLVLLLSVEIIIKLRKISSSERSSSEPPDPPPIDKKQSLSGSEGREGSVPKAIPVIIHPPTPLQQLNAGALPVEVVQHR